MAFCLNVTSFPPPEVVAGGRYFDFDVWRHIRTYGYRYWASPSEAVLLPTTAETRGTGTERALTVAGILVQGTPGFSWILWRPAIYQDGGDDVATW